MLQNSVILALVTSFMIRKVKRSLRGWLTTLIRLLIPSSSPESFSLMSLALEMTPAGTSFKVAISFSRCCRGFFQAPKRMSADFSKTSY